jgi:aminopeptidase N
MFRLIRVLIIFSTMKKSVLPVILILSALRTTGQFNVPASFDKEYCYHAKACEEQARTYYTPVTANTLQEQYDVTFYFLDLNAENNTVALSGNVTIKAKSLVTALDTIVLDFITAMPVDSVRVDGINKVFLHDNDLITVPLTNPVAEGNYFSIQVFYQGTPPTGGFFSGITTDYSSNFDKHVTWTLSEPFAAREWWPTKQDLRDKADSVYVFLTTSAENKAGSEGLLTAITPMPGGKLRYEWKSRYPIDYYLISFAVADYQDYSIYAHPEGTEDSVLIQNYIYDDPDFLPAYKVDIDRTAAFIELFSDLFGMYPFIDEKYGHCMTQLGGGMEHQTMTTLGGFGYGLVAHELCHMWFGDKVTCENWSDIWLNEGFATYGEYLAHHFLSTPYYDSLWLKLVNDAVKVDPGGSVYVPPDQTGDIGRIFDSRLTYKKGSLVLHMIRFELQDDDLFFNIMKTYNENYAYSVATAQQFKAWVEEKSGRDFTDFFNQWYYGEGYPIYDIAWYQEGNTLDITSTQTTSTNITTLFKMHVPYLLTFDDGTDTTLILYQGTNLEKYAIPLSKTVSRIDIDPKQWILYKLNSMVMDVEERNGAFGFSVGPNPASDQIRIFINPFPVKDLKMIILDITGRAVLEKNLQDASESTDISKLAPGIYQVRVTDGKLVEDRKLIVE